MSELTDVEAMIIVIFLVILSIVYGINEIKGANQRIKQLKRIRKENGNDDKGGEME